MDYLQMPWSIEQTIADLNVIRYSMIKRLRTVNLDGKAEQDVKELNFDFDKAVNALKEIQQYRQIGTLSECYGYKTYTQNISELHNCNDCGRSRDCEIIPRLGEYCRINCYLWEKREVHQ